MDRFRKAISNDVCPSQGYSFCRDAGHLNQRLFKLTATIIFIAAIALTYVAWEKSSEYVERIAQEQFIFQTQKAAAAIQQRMLDYEQLLRGGVALFNSSERVTRAEWHNYISALQIDVFWPGIQGVGFAAMLRPAELPGFVGSVRREGFPDFAVTPAGSRDEYSSILYLEPFDWRNRRAFGFDMFSEPVRHDAMALARDTGQAVVSARVTLVQETESDVQPGFLMYLPLYRNGAPLDTVTQRRSALVGYVYSPFRINDLMSGMLGIDSPLLNFEIHDGSGDDPASLLYKTDLAPGRTGFESKNLARLPIQLPGRVWTAHFRPTRYFETRTRDNLPTVIGLGGLTIDALLLGLFSTIYISRKRVLENAMQLRIAARCMDSTSEAVMVTDRNAVIRAVNPAFTQITGYTAGEVIGKRTSLLKSDHHDAKFYRQLWQTLLASGHWEGEVWNRRKNGELFLEWLSINRLEGEGEQPHFFFAIFHDITEQRKEDERVRHMAFHDALTGLPNRVLLIERLEHALERAARDPSALALLFIDLDGFKAVNDTLGHEVGDRLLVEAASRMRSQMRRGIDAVARLGGDEFVVLLEEVKSETECANLADKLIDAISAPMSLYGHVVTVGASVGVAYLPADVNLRDAMRFLKLADEAMYVAKSRGKGCYHIVNYS